MKNYNVVEETNLAAFKRLCDIMLRDGWIPIGGISTVMNDKGKIIYSQAFGK